LSLSLPVLLAGAAPLLRAALAGAFALAALALAAAEGARPSWPKRLYVLSLVVAVALALGASSWVQAAALVGLQHYVVALGLTARMAARAAPAPRPAWAPALLLILLGLIPAYLGWRCGQMPHLDPLLRGWLDNGGRGLGFKLAAAAVFGLSYAHNGWDAAVFRFKDASVRAVSLPLIFGA
jgi:type IV secretory pathway TrbD component